MSVKHFFSRSKKDVLYDLNHRYGISALERALSSHWINPFLTFWVNFRCFKFSQAIHFPFYVYGRPGIYDLYGSMEIVGDVRRGMIKFNQTRPGSPNNQSVQSDILLEGHIIFRGFGVIGTGVHLCVGRNGILDLGKDFKIADMTNIGCCKSIKIGPQTRITHKCQIIDTNYHYIANFNSRTIPDCEKKIEIGKGCWICNNSTVTGGTVIPDFTILSSNSLANKDYSDIKPGSILGGIPAKHIASGYRRVENPGVFTQVFDHYKTNSGKFVMPEDLDENLCSNFV